MIRPAALVMGMVAVGVAAGTYYGLDYVPPGLLPQAIRPAALADQPQPGGGETLAEATGIRAGTHEALAKAPAEEPAVTEQDLAEEPPPEETLAASETQVPAPATAATEPPPEPAAAQAQAPTEPEAVEEKPAPAPQPVPKPAPAKPKAPAKAQAPAAEPHSAPASVKPKPPEADVIKPWWPNPDSMPANQLKLQYAGQVQGEQAIALLFSAPLNLETLKQHASVLTATGQTAEGSWELGKNTRLAVFRGVKPGRYTVVLQPPVADTKGFMLGTKLQGPVYVKAP